MSHELKTPETHPDHQVVGHRFSGYSIKHRKEAAWFCESYDPSCGYWLRNEADPEDRINVSERAIGRTFHDIWDDDPQWPAPKTPA